MRKRIISPWPNVAASRRGLVVARCSIAIERTRRELDSLLSGMLFDGGRSKLIGKTNKVKLIPRLLSLFACQSQAERVQISMGASVHESIQNHLSRVRAICSPSS